MSSQYHRSSDLIKLTNDEVLQRSLDIRSIISTTSSYAQRTQQAIDSAPENQDFVQIGAGLQGTVFEQIGRPFAIKQEAPGNALLSTCLSHEISMHQAVTAAFDKYDNTIGSNVHVPRIQNIIDHTNDRFWQQNLDRFPAGYRARANLVEMERILPLPKITRQALIAELYLKPSSLIDIGSLDTILNHGENKHCLVRTYLGKKAVSTQTFSLRNLPLYSDSMLHYHVNVEQLARSMGKAFALMHWGAGVNGDDVEFVFGTSLAPGHGDGNEDEDEGLQHRAVGLYLLDFGQCESVDLFQDPEVVYQAFKGAMITGDNQLFIPHYRVNPATYTAFKMAYIHASQNILISRNLTKFNAKEFMTEYEEYAEDFL
ncbi:hypothetical protein G7046_g1153 [Stylonectria norvegica]|nr:hypothetical protein G7046_g1153 [Stylonectria norvegica]